MVDWYVARFSMDMDGSSWTSNGHAAYREPAPEGLKQPDSGEIQRFLRDAMMTTDAAITERVNGFAIVDDRYVFSEHLLDRTRVDTYRLVNKDVSGGYDVATAIGFVSGAPVAVVMGRRTSPKEAREAYGNGAGGGWPKCPACEGSGREEMCAKCDGEGVRECTECGHENDCDACNGHGRVGRCATCNGAKVLRPEPAQVA